MTLQQELQLFAPEFEKLMNNKNSTKLLVERIFKPDKYPDFHRHLDIIHELWILEVKGWKT